MKNRIPLFQDDLVKFDNETKKYHVRIKDVCSYSGGGILLTFEDGSKINITTGHYAEWCKDWASKDTSWSDHDPSKKLHERKTKEVYFSISNFIKIVEDNSDISHFFKR